MRYKITLSFDGAAFCGWQRQSDVPSVQQCLENALCTLLRQDISVTGAGRTDAGVNALGYVADFEVGEGAGPEVVAGAGADCVCVGADALAGAEAGCVCSGSDALAGAEADCAGADLDAEGLVRKLNALLPREIVVNGIEPARDEFNSRFDAREREYTYYLHRAKDPFVEAYSYQYSYPEVDFDAMNEAAALLLGERDFSCFEKTGSDNKTSICDLRYAKWERYTPTICAGTGEYWKFTIRADRFLRNMVRAIVGTLLEVGRGKRTPDDIPALLASKNRCLSGESVPGHALFLSGIKY